MEHRLCRHFFEDFAGNGFVAHAHIRHLHGLRQLCQEDIFAGVALGDDQRGEHAVVVALLNHQLLDLLRRKQAGGREQFGQSVGNGRGHRLHGPLRANFGQQNADTVESVLHLLHFVGQLLQAFGVGHP